MSKGKDSKKATKKTRKKRSCSTQIIGNATPII